MDRRKTDGAHTHQCPHCHKSLSNWEDYELHVLTEHFDQQQVHVARHAHVCPDCGASFEHLDDLEAHSLMDHSEKYSDVTDMDPKRPGPPTRTFVPQSGVGPTVNQFAPFASEKIKAMLNKRLIQRIEKPQNLPKPRCDKSILGQHRGVEGFANSCYFDCLAMILAFLTQFDGIYSQEALDQSVLLRIILFEVVIPLRTMMFVSRDVIAMVRYYLAETTGNQGYREGIQDFDEFFNDFMGTINTETVCDFRSDNSIESKFTFPISASKPFKSLQSGLDDCLRSRTVTVEQPPFVFFVRVRPEFRVRPLALPQMVLNVFGEVYNLYAILCIETAHYMCFLCLPNGKWVFFDSMQGFDNGHCIPTTTLVPGFEDYIRSGCDERLLPVKSYGREGESKHSFHDLVTKYAYLYLFTRNTVSAPAVSVPAVSSEISDCLAQARQLYQENAEQLAAAGGGAAAVSAHSFKQLSAGGGAAATSSSHREPTSFGHFQQKRPLLSTFSGSKFPPFTYPLALFDATTCLVKEYVKHISSFRVGDLMLVCDDLRGDGKKEPIQVFGSFGFFDAKGVEHRFRATGFVFEDGTVVNHEGSVETLSKKDIKDAFMRRVGGKWQSSIITSITFQRC
jgi:hypothetical protein